MEIIYLPEDIEDLDYWILTKNKSILKRIAKLTESIIQSPFRGIGKPEALIYNLIGKWSRRISEEHRYIYQMHKNVLVVYSLKGHY